MSYILDALRRADAQRQRDPARGIHAQPPAAGPSAFSAPAGRPPVGWIAAMIGVVLAVAAAAYLLRPAPAGQALVPEGASAAGSAVSPAASPAVSAGPAGGPMVAQAPMGDPASPPASVLLPPAPPITPVVRAPAPRPVGNVGGDAGQAPGSPGRSDTRATVAQAPGGPPQPMATRAAPQGDPSAAGGMRAAPAPPTAPLPLPGVGAPPAAPPAVRGAPGRIGAAPPAPPGAVPPTAVAAQAAPRQEVPPGAPPLVVTGGVYSANPAQRMLIVNGQVYNEGSQPAPGVVLEEIRSGSAVLSFGGSRFSVRY